MTDRDPTDADDRGASPATASSSKMNIGMVVALAALIIAGGVGYVVWTANRLDKTIEERNAAAAARLEAFSQTSNEDSTGASGDADAVTDDLVEPAPDPASDADDNASATVAVEEARAAPPSVGDIAFVNRIPGDDYLRLSVIGDDGERRLLDRSCDRFHTAEGTLLCLTQTSLGLYQAQLIDLTDPESPVVHSEVAALPSRARLSQDGQWASWTVFISGSGYQDVGGFSTVVRIRDIAAGRSADMSTYEVVSDRTEFKFDEPTYWGVSFGTDGEFWVTGQFDGFLEVLKGSTVDQTLTPTGLTGSCPSVSPDGKTLVYKRQVIEYGKADRYQLVAHDLETGNEWELGESRSVDDQVEWLDNDTILYGLHAPGVEVAAASFPEFDVWQLDIAEGSEPELLIPLADSPSVTHP